MSIFLLLLTFVFILFNTYKFKPNNANLKVELVEQIPIPVGAVERMTEAISIRTVSFEEEVDFDSTQFQLFNNFLSENYPTLHLKAEHKIFSTYSHLYKLIGKQPSKKPILIMGHHDVVPIASPALWNVHPFTEGIKNDTIFGRGCIDDKGAVISILESIEQLLKEGFEPERTIYFAFGHDEEVSGRRGAAKISKYLEESKIELAFVLDEGGAITQGLVPGMQENIALIGIAEKGYVTFELETQMVGGHSSQPGNETSIDVLATAISKLKQNPLPRKMTPVLKAFMNELGPYMGFKERMVFANKWLFNSLILNEYGKSNQGNASIRTTTAPTIFEAGIKENVIPTASRAVVNFRIIPGETIETVKEHILKVIADDRVSINLKGDGFNPSPISPMENDAYQLISKSIKEIFPNVIISPNLVLGATDSRYYSKVCPNVYRFAPFKLTPKNINCFHGVDERIPKEEFENAIRFYRQVIINGSHI